MEIITDDNPVRPRVRVEHFVKVHLLDAKAKTLKVFVFASHFKVNDLDAHFRDGSFCFFYGDVDGDVPHVQFGCQVCSSPRNLTVNNLFPNDEI